MRILGIETSCDETAAAVIEDGTKILSNVVASSQNLHKKTGGIIPEAAAREQIKCMIPVLNETLRLCSGQAMKDIDAVAVTVGPGLIGSLLVGVETAKTIAYVTGKPIIPVNHIFAHIYANWIKDGEKPKFPAIALVISGGHSELFLMKSHTDLKWIGGTRDDAAGEAFDKTARLLGLGYPGGPAIAAAAENFRILNSKYKNKIYLPRPMISEENFDFSFSGLKTAVLREFNKIKTNYLLNDLSIQHLAHELQESITDVLVKKTVRAAQQYNVRSILLGGGVAANKRLTEKFKLKIENLKLKIVLYIPPPALCTDNAAAIACYAYFHNNPVPWQQIQAKPNLEIEV